MGHLLKATENVRYFLIVGDQGHHLKMHVSWTLKDPNILTKMWRESSSQTMHSNDGSLA